MTYAVRSSAQKSDTFSFVGIAAKFICKQAIHVSPKAAPSRRRSTVHLSKYFCDCADGL